MQRNVLALDGESSARQSREMNRTTNTKTPNSNIDGNRPILLIHTPSDTDADARVCTATRCDRTMPHMPLLDNFLQWSFPFALSAPTTSARLRIYHIWWSEGGGVRGCVRHTTADTTPGRIAWS